MKTLVSFILFFSQAVYGFMVLGSATKNLNRWTDFSKSESLSLHYLMDRLASSPSGKKLLRKAQLKARREGKKLKDVIQAGEASLTDTTLTRRFRMSDPSKVSFESTSVVFVNRYLSEKDAILDLAHELTHYIAREPFNPYVKNFTLKSFIRSTVEGPGGEVSAFMSECEVLKDLYGTKEIKKSICGEIYSHHTGKFERKLAIAKFYHVGEHFDEFSHELQKKHLHHHFPEIKGKKAVFISSAYGKPYPVAALEEYQQVMSRACANDYRRIRLYRKKAQRAPASLTKSYRERCE